MLSLKLSSLCQDAKGCENAPVEAIRAAHVAFLSESKRRAQAMLRVAALGGALCGSLGTAHAQGAPDLGAYQKAKINWRLAEGQRVNVAVIPAAYFDNLIALTPEFEALTGVKVQFDKVPPGQIRQKAVLDLSSKTGNISTHAADPMYLPLYAANKWTEALET